MSRCAFSQFDAEILERLDIYDFIVKLQNEKFSFLKLYKIPIVETFKNSSGNFLFIKLAPFFGLRYYIGKSIHTDEVEYFNRTWIFDYQNMFFIFDDTNDFYQRSSRFFKGTNPWNVSITSETNGMNLLIHKLSGNFHLSDNRYNDISHLKVLDEFLAQNFWTFLNPLEFINGFSDTFNYYNPTDNTVKFNKIWSPLRSQIYNHNNIFLKNPPNRQQGLFEDLDFQETENAHKYSIWLLEQIVKRYVLDEFAKDYFPNSHPFKTEGPIHYLTKFEEEFLKKAT